MSEQPRCTHTCTCTTEVECAHDCDCWDRLDLLDHDDQDRANGHGRWSHP